MPCPGTGLYLTGAMVNHSCDPSCVQSFRGKTLIMRAVRPLAEGDEITIAYAELAATRQERRLGLMRDYFFDIDGPGAASGPFSSDNSTSAKLVELPGGTRLWIHGHAGWRKDPADDELTQIVVPGTCGCISR